LDLETGSYVVEHRQICAGIGGDAPVWPQLHQVRESWCFRIAEDGTGSA
jgi:hypothetical protein